MAEPLIVGAIAYTPNVVPIWEGIRDYFADSPAELDFVLFSNYGRQVDALLAGTIDIAWNTNLAWVRTVLRTEGACRALAMRDTDVTFATVFVTRPGSGLRDLTDLRACLRTGFGALTGRLDRRRRRRSKGLRVGRVSVGVGAGRVRPHVRWLVRRHSRTSWPGIRYGPGPTTAVRLGPGR